MSLRSEVQRIARLNAGVAVSEVLAVALAFARAGRERHAKAADGDAAARQRSRRQRALALRAFKAAAREQAGSGL